MSCGRADERSLKPNLAVLQGPRVDGLEAKSREAGGQPVLPPPPSSAAWPPLCVGRPTLQRSAMPEVDSARAQVGPPPQLRTSSSALTPASRQGPAALASCGPFKLSAIVFAWRRHQPAASPAWKVAFQEGLRPQFPWASDKLYYQDTTRRRASTATGRPRCQEDMLAFAQPSISLTPLERAHPQRGTGGHNKTSGARLPASGGSPTASVSAPNYVAANGNLGNYPSGGWHRTQRASRRHRHRSDRLRAEQGASPPIYSYHRPGVELCLGAHAFHRSSPGGGNPAVHNCRGLSG